MKKQSHRGEEDTTPPSPTSSAWNGNDIDEEAVGLLFNHSDSPTKGGSDHAGKYTAPAVTYHRTWIVLVVAVVFSLGFAGIILTNKTFHQAVDTPAGDYVEPSKVLQCPILTIDLREDDVDFGKYIHQGDKYGLRDKNATELWEWMQTSNVDGWGRSYHKERARIYDFTVREFLPYFIRKLDEKSTNDNSIHIYESACGVGQKLIMTLDIVRENLTKKILNDNSNNEDTTVVEVLLSGNDYVSDSAEAARTIIGSPAVMEPFFGARLGTICGGVDSTNLSHIPSNSFDIVYTGYVGPLHDPLCLSTEYPDKRNRDKAYRSLCRNAMKQSDNDDNNNEQGGKDYQEAQDQVQRMVQIQEDWYAKWVGEMIRIAKPGSPVLVEDVPVAFCQDMYDNGGVNRDFWIRTTAAAATMEDSDNRDYPNSWGQVDPDSIHFMDVTKKEKRYHISMMKKN